MSSWLYNLEGLPRDRWKEWKPGTSRDFWTAARQDRTGDVILRKDRRGAGQPRWQVGDEVVGYDIDAGRCIAILSVASSADWNKDDQTWNFSLDLVTLDWDGPAPEDVGITITQGARKRLTPDAYRHAYRAITKSTA